MKSQIASKTCPVMLQIALAAVVTVHNGNNVM
jgi:hypothetical protein